MYKRQVIDKPITQKVNKDIFTKDLEKDLARRLGTKANILPKKNGGKLIVTYYSDDDLERIQMLMGNSNK